MQKFLWGMFGSVGATIFLVLALIGADENNMELWWPWSAPKAQTNTQEPMVEFQRALEAPPITGLPTGWIVVGPAERLKRAYEEGHFE